MSHAGLYGFEERPLDFHDVEFYRGFDSLSKHLRRMGEPWRGGAMMRHVYEEISASS